MFPSVQLARAIDSDCSRLSSDHIQIVISFTHSSATRLLRDAAGNSSFLAEEAGISSQGARLIEIDPEAAAKTTGWNCVYVNRYSPGECDRAYEVYASAYRVDVPKSHSKTTDPYVLGIAMREYRGQQLPDSLDEPTLLRSFIVNKIGRAVGLDSYDVPLCLRELGREMFRSGAPVPVEAVCKLWAHPISQKIPSGFFESALLTVETDATGHSAIDFYYGRERDYVVACMAQDWLRRLASDEDMDAEFSLAVETNAGKDALAWVLRQPSTVSLLTARPAGIPTYSNASVRRILTLSLCEFSSSNGAEDEDLLRYAVVSAMNDPDNLARIEAVKLVALSSEDSEHLASVVGDGSSLEEFIEAILSVSSEFAFNAKDAGRVVLDALRSLHWDSGNSDDDGASQISNILVSLGERPKATLRKEANTCLGYVAPLEFLRTLAEKIEQRSTLIRQDNFAEFAGGIRNAAHALSDSYYGDMCPGCLEAILEDRDYQAAEYWKMAKLLSPIIHVFGGIPGIDTFESILQDLGRGLDTAAGAEESGLYLDVQTLPLPFDDDSK